MGWRAHSHEVCVGILLGSFGDASTVWWGATLPFTMLRATTSPLFVRPIFHYWGAERPINNDESEQDGAGYKVPVITSEQLVHQCTKMRQPAATASVATAVTLAVPAS